MDCDRMRESFEPYAAGKLGAEDAARLEAHVRSCPACGRQLRWVTTLKAAVRSAPRPAMPAELRVALLRQARAAVRPQEAPARPRPGWLDSLRLSWRAAAGFGFASAFAAGAAFLVFGRFSAAGTEGLSLDEVLAAHSRYELTMPAADREAIFVDLGLRLAGGGGPR